MSVTDDEVVEVDYDKILVERMLIVMDNELDIDIDEPVYLITWSPDPAELPDSDVYYQNQFNVNLLADFLKCCQCGLFCMELNQMGNVHYHGWYQIDQDKDVERSIVVKTMRRFGPQLKIAKARKYKLNNYNEKGNSLYYYKEWIGSYLGVIDAVITKDSRSLIDWTSLWMNTFFTKEGKIKDLRDKVSARKFAMEFYRDSS